MSEYWKSNAKKYCDYCKVWISDNKASINCLFLDSFFKSALNQNRKLIT